VVKTNRSTLHTVYDIHVTVYHTGQQWNNTHKLSPRTATIRFSPESIGCQKQMAPRSCQHLIRWALTSQTFTTWRHLSTHR